MIRSGKLEIQRNPNIGTAMTPLGVTSAAFAQAYGEAFRGIDLSKPYDVEIAYLPIIDTSVVFCSDGRTETARIVTPEENIGLGPVRKLIEIIVNNYDIPTIVYVEPNDEPFFHISPNDPAPPSWQLVKTSHVEEA